MNKKPGFMTTSLLEEMVKDYIDTHIVIKRCLDSGQIVKEYIGNPNYLILYAQLKTYNKLGEEK